MNPQGLCWAEKEANPKKSHAVWFYYITFWNDNILEVENGLVVAKVGVRVGVGSRVQEESRYGYKRATVGHSNEKIIK